MTLSKSPHNPGAQHSDHRTLCRAPVHTHAEQRQPDRNPPSQRADHTDHNDQATQNSSRQGETPPEVLEDSGGKIPLIIKDLDLYVQPPTSTRSPTLNSEEPFFRPIRDEVAGHEVTTPVSPVLITKILMGTLGCVPAYDRFFQDSVAKYKVTTQEYSLNSVLRLVEFYEAHNDRLEEARRGMQCEDLTYPQMKLLDMGFWQIGFETSLGV